MKRIVILAMLCWSVGEAQTSLGSFGGISRTFWRDSSGVIVPVPAGKLVVLPIPSVGSSGYWTRGTAPNSGTVYLTTATDTAQAAYVKATTGFLGGTGSFSTVTPTGTTGRQGWLTRGTAPNSGTLTPSENANDTLSIVYMKLGNSGGNLQLWGVGNQGNKYIEIYEAGPTDPGFIRLLESGIVEIELTSNGASYFTGTLRSTDTLRVGNWTTYSYIIPGGALVQSSDTSLKTNIRQFANLDLSKFSNIKPRVFNFKEKNFYGTFDESSLPDTLTTTQKAKRRADWTAKNRAEATQMASADYKGFLAQEYNQLWLGRTSKEIDYGELTGVLWLKVAELEGRIKTLEAR